MRIVPSPCPHHGARPADAVIDTIVLHCDASKVEHATVAWLKDPASKVSYHALVSRDGLTIYTFVPAERRAWHAGISRFRGVDDVNDYSLGVCFANRNDGEPYPDAQIFAAAAYVAGLMRRFPAITLERVTTHRAVAQPPGRKTDPAAPFDLTAFRQLVAEELAR